MDYLNTNSFSSVGALMTKESPSTITWLIIHYIDQGLYGLHVAPKPFLVSPPKPGHSRPHPCLPDSEVFKSPCQPHAMVCRDHYFRISTARSHTRVTWPLSAKSWTALIYRESLYFEWRYLCLTWLQNYRHQRVQFFESLVVWSRDFLKMFSLQLDCSQMPVRVSRTVLADLCLWPSQL